MNEEKNQYSSSRLPSTGLNSFMKDIPLFSQIFTDPYVSESTLRLYSMSSKNEFPLPRFR